MVIAPDGRVFVCLQGGQLRVIKNGTLLETPFLSVAVDSNGERGLLGVAFDPDFTTNQYVYVYYTALNPSHNRVARFTANGDVAVAGSEALILRLPDLTTATSHNAGAIHFGVDGKLYVAVGDNGDAASAQSLDNPLGKLLRIDKDGGIPSDNPFVTTAQGQNRAIWALGLRNPFTFAVQPGTGLVFINDVGAAKWEEINRGLAGANYGWPTCEGACATPGFTNPIFAYRHGSSSTRGCAITGGAFYNAATEPFPTEFVGQYFFADYCSGWIRRLDPSTAKATDFAAGIVSPVDLRVGDDGALYYLTRYDGSVWKVTYPGSQTPPTFTLHPADQTVAIGQSATFSVSVEGPGPISYEWRRNDVAIPATSSTAWRPIRTDRRSARWQRSPSRRTLRRPAPSRRPRPEACTAPAPRSRSRAPGSTPRTARCRRRPSPGGSTSITTRTSIRFCRTRRGRPAARSSSRRQARPRPTCGTAFTSRSPIPRACRTRRSSISCLAR
jgi:glucose/arabinose dehydrogenase